MSNYTIYKCPVCGKQLNKNNNSYSCDQKHTYDIAKEGYVNLLLANQMKSKEPGDSKEMMLARSSFLNRGYFEELSDYINGVLLAYYKSVGGNVFTLFDAGCGEGYYTDRIYNSLAGKNDVFDAYGMDISKEAVKLAAKRSKAVSFCVGSIFHIPVLDNSVDCILNVFAPFKEEEFYRVLKQGGIIIKVTPGARHLLGLKKALYDTPYLNDEEIPDTKSFIAAQSFNISYGLHIDNTQDIASLLKMTPYYWNTNINRVNEFIKEASELDTEIDFIITVLYKEEKK